MDRPLAAERDNILVALQFATDRGDAAGCVPGAAMAAFDDPGRSREAARRLRAALNAERRGPVPAAEAAALGGSFNTVMSGGDVGDDPHGRWPGPRRIRSRR